MRVRFPLSLKHGLSLIRLALTHFGRGLGFEWCMFIPDYNEQPVMVSVPVFLSYQEWCIVIRVAGRIYVERVMMRHSDAIAYII